jgi:hypothetical protein
MLIETFVARYNSYVWYFYYYGAGKLLPRVANHVRGCWAWGVLPSGCSRVITGATLRPRAKILYPQLYATPEQAAANPAVFAYNCAQRAHANYVENLLPAIGSMLVAGLSYPTITGWLGVGWLGCRLVYFYNYTRVQSGTVVPEKPPMGHAVSLWLFQYGLHALSVKAAWDIFSMGRMIHESTG